MSVRELIAELERRDGDAELFVTYQGDDERMILRVADDPLPEHVRRDWGIRPDAAIVRLEVAVS